MRRLLILAAIATCACVDTARPPNAEEHDAGISPPAQRDATIAHDDAAMTANEDAETVAHEDAETTVHEDAETIPPDAGEMPPPSGVPVLGNGGHQITDVTLTEISSGGMSTPRALAFNPQGNMELWVVNMDDDSTVTFFNTGAANQTAEFRIDPYALHFMDAPDSIVFGAPGNFATCQESRNTYANTQPPDDLMGPTLWPSDMNIYAHTNPQAVADIGFDLGSHIDMLHESPWCMGIAWDHDNVYWTFDGLWGSISRYDYQVPHQPGYDDHTDGIVQRYVVGEVERVPGVPSHLVLDHATHLLYIADTGHARIAVLDTTRGTPDSELPPREEGVSLTLMQGVSTTTLVDAASGNLHEPSGILLRDDLLFVSDHQSSRITAFDKNTGAPVDWLDTGFAHDSLMGMAFDAQGDLYFVDSADARLYRISPK